MSQRQSKYALLQSGWLVRTCSDRCQGLDWKAILAVYILKKENLLFLFIFLVSGNCELCFHFKNIRFIISKDRKNAKWFFSTFQGYYNFKFNLLSPKYRTIMFQYLGLLQYPEAISAGCFAWFLDLYFCFCRDFQTKSCF